MKNYETVLAAALALGYGVHYETGSKHGQDY